MTSEVGLWNDGVVDQQGDVERSGDCITTAIPNWLHSTGYSSTVLVGR